MFVINSESYTGFPFDCDVPRDTVIAEVVVTGTHSAGKSTLIGDYGAQTELLEDVTGYKVPFGYVAGYEDIEGLTIPVVIAPEAATYYSQSIAKTNRVVTDRYTLEDQIGMESIANRMIVRANIIAAHLANRLQRDVRWPVAMVASDRSQLDGHVYSAIRLPDAEHEHIDIAAVAKATGGRPPANNPGHPIAYREKARINAAESFSLAFIAEHSEVPFQTSEHRLDDLEFRDKIARAMTEYYETIMGADKVITLTGNRVERLNDFKSHIRMLARYMIQAETCSNHE